MPLGEPELLHQQIEAAPFPKPQLGQLGEDGGELVVGMVAFQGRQVAPNAGDGGLEALP